MTPTLRWWGEPRDRPALIAHGAGSSAEFVARAFADPLAGAGYRLASWDQRGGDVDDELAAAAAASRAVLVGGVSRGAHAAARWAAGRGGLDGVLVVLPAWTGPPTTVAAGSAQSADEVERAGVSAVLARLLRDQPGWIADELARAWPAYGAGLVPALREAARAAGPTAAELAAVRAPAGLVALAGDPLHPERVARRWAETLPHAALRVLPAQAPAANRAALGRAAVEAWRQARRPSSPTGSR